MRINGDVCAAVLLGEVQPEKEIALYNLNWGAKYETVHLPLSSINIRTNGSSTRVSKQSPIQVMSNVAQLQ